MAADGHAGGPRRCPIQDRYAEVNGIRLHYLDWGGPGPVMLMVPGLWSTAHSYDALAPHFTNRYHVVGVTRREHGASQRTTGPISIDLLVDDLSDFLRLFTSQPAVIVGHSYAGVELPKLARDHPEQVAALVFLDAVYDWPMWMRADQPPFPTRWTFPPEFGSLEAMERWFSETYSQVWGEALRATLHSQVFLASDASVRWQMPWDGPKAANFTAEYANWSAGYFSGIEVPVLSIQADFPGFFERDFERWTVSEADRRSARAWAAYDAEVKRRGREQLAREVPQAEHELLSDTHHWLFLQKPDAVAERMHAFLSKGRGAVRQGR